MLVRMVGVFGVVVAAWAMAGCGGGSSSGPMNPPLPPPDTEVDPVVRAFVEEAVRDLEVESSRIWTRRNQFNIFGSALTLLGTSAIFDGVVIDPPRFRLDAAPVECLSPRAGDHRLWRELRRCRQVGRDQTTYTPLLFIAEPPFEDPGARHRVTYTSDDGTATITYEENPLVVWDVVDRPALTASTTIFRDVEIEAGGETFDLRYDGTLEIDEPGGGIVTMDLRFPAPRLIIELTVPFVGDPTVTGTITRGTITLGTIGGQSGALRFDW